MEHVNIDIEACIRDAERMRSKALGDLLVKGWHVSTRALTGLTHWVTQKLSTALTHQHPAAS